MLVIIEVREINEADRKFFSGFDITKYGIKAPVATFSQDINSAIVYNSEDALLPKVIKRIKKQLFGNPIVELYTIDQRSM